MRHVSGVPRDLIQYDTNHTFISESGGIVVVIDRTIQEVCVVKSI